jgi:hypothetical protein
MAPTDHELLTAIHEDMAVLKEKVVNACKDDDEVKHDLYGNARKGLKQDVTGLKTNMTMLIKVGTIVATAAITGAIGTIWQLVTGRG